MLFPAFDEQYAHINPEYMVAARAGHVEQGHRTANLGILNIFRYLKVEGLQKQVDEKLIATLQQKLDEIDAADKLARVFEIYHQASLDEDKYGRSVG